MQPVVRAWCNQTRAVGGAAASLSTTQRQRCVHVQWILALRKAMECFLYVRRPTDRPDKQVRVCACVCVCVCVRGCLRASVCVSVCVRLRVQMSLADGCDGLAGTACANWLSASLQVAVCAADRAASSSSLFQRARCVQAFVHVCMCVCVYVCACAGVCAATCSCRRPLATR